MRAPFLATLAIAAIAVMAAPATAQSPPGGGAFGLDLLSPGQRVEVMKRVESYALVEVFLRACGRPPALEARFRRVASGCIRADTIRTLTGEYRRAVAARSGLRWDCRSANGRRMIARSEQAIRLTFADLGRLCRRG